MTINDWWNELPNQRFWMEITDRLDLGEDLRAPKGGRDGKSVWHYELVSFTRPGDIVFHWHTNMMGRPALVGWSLVIGSLKEEMHPWKSHAGTDRANLSNEPRPNWVMPLGGLNLFDRPLYSTDLVSMRTELFDIKDRLQASVRNSLYFPFTRYRENVRAAEAYLTKFPVELVELFGVTFDQPVAEHNYLEVDDETRTNAIRKGTGQGYLRDTERKIAIEQHAVERAITFYESLGATDIEILGKPFDIRLHLEGKEIHIEVKGSSNTIETVQVTRNEVAHAREFERVELFVVDEIEWTRQADDALVTTGGRFRRWRNWKPSDESLTALTFSHVLPSEMVTPD